MESKRSELVNKQKASEKMWKLKKKANLQWTCDRAGRWGADWATRESTSWAATRPSARRSRRSLARSRRTSPRRKRCAAFVYSTASPCDDRCRPRCRASRWTACIWRVFWARLVGCCSSARQDRRRTRAAWWCPLVASDCEPVECWRTNARVWSACRVWGAL